MFKSLSEADVYLNEKDPVTIQQVTGPSEPNADALIVYTDGSSLYNGRIGARACAGVYFGADDKRNQSARIPTHERQSNQRAELLAVLLALRVAGEEHRLLEVRTDSKWVISGMTEWCHRWKMNGWRTSTGDLVLHQDLWLAIIDLVEGRQGGVFWRHVKGHSNEPGNDAADLLARRAALSDFE